jgi:hypothetical protein
MVLALVFSSIALHTASSVISSVFLVRALFAYALKETCRHTASRNPTGSAALSNHARRALQAGCFSHPCLPM